MNPFQSFTALTHHAYFIKSFKDSFLHLKDALKKKFSISHSENPDFFYQKFEVFSIDDSRKLKEMHSSRSFKEGDKRIFVIEASAMTHEAQNSLLKIFEEPNEDNHSFLIMPSVELLLPTLRSRLQVIETVVDEKEEKENHLEILKFIKLSKKEKIDFVDKIAKDISDEKIGKSDAQKFLQNLEVYLRDDGIEKNKTALKALVKASGYMNDKSSSIKQLLEYVALYI